MKILLIRFSSFGDVVLTTPVIKAIKDNYPKAEIDFIVYNAFADGITLNPRLRKVIKFDRKKSKIIQPVLSLRCSTLIVHTYITSNRIEALT